MSAPVISPSSTSTASASAGGGASGASHPSATGLFGNMFSLNLPSFTMNPTSNGQFLDMAANTTTAGPISSLLEKSHFSLQQALFISSDQGNLGSQKDLESLLTSFKQTSDELTPGILVALTPGVPSNEILEQIRNKFAELGIDPSKLESISITDSSFSSGLSLDTSDADQAGNFLLITTGFTPSEMADIKASIKALSENDLNQSFSLRRAEDRANEIDASNAAIVMMVFLSPLPKVDNIEMPKDQSFDLSTLSGFIQLSRDSAKDHINHLTDEAAWAKKLSDKLGSISLTDEISPFDEELNAILSFTPQPKSDDGFQGSLSSSSHLQKETSGAKSIVGEISSKTAMSLDQATLLSPGLIDPLGGDMLLTANGHILSSQSTSSLINPLFTSGSAIATHPSVHAVATFIEKAATGSEKAKQELSLQLDPPELGRMQVQLSIEKDGQMKVHLMAEKQETLALFQRDSHALKFALDSAGLQIDQSSLTFDLASGDQSFNQLMNGSNKDHQSRNGESGTGPQGSAQGDDTHISDIVETKMIFTPHSVTGNVHYSFLA